MNTGRQTQPNRSLVVLCVAAALLVSTSIEGVALAVEDTTYAATATAEAEVAETTQTSTEPAEDALEGDAQDVMGEVDVQETVTSPAQTSEEVATSEATVAEDEMEAAGKTATPTKESTSLSVTVAFSSPEGEWWQGAIALASGSTAWDATLAALRESGMAYEVGSASADDVIVSLAQGYDGISYALDTSTGSAWHLYVNGDRYMGSASTLVVAEADVLEWRFEVGTVMVSVSVVGPGGTGLDYWISPTNVNVDATQSVWEASRTVFEQNGYVDGRLLSYAVGEDGSVELESLASLGANGITGETWQVFVNGMQPTQNVAHMIVRAGDSICWYYAGNGESELPTFAAKTGAASQSPATTVRLEGSVSQAWTYNTVDRTNLSVRINTATGVTVSGSRGLWSLSSTTRSLPNSLGLDGGSRPWYKSLARLVGSKLGTGEGGRATFGADGSLYYLDDLGSVVKLELTD